MLRSLPSAAALAAALAFLALLAAPHARALDVGDAAPDFALPASDGETYVLSDVLEEGPVVLAWYPQAFTSGCTLECKSFKEDGHRIRAYDVRYFMASVDPPERNRRFARSVGADFPLLSDESRDVARAYGVLHQDRFAFRTNFFIGTDGRILAIQRNVDPRTAARDVAAELAELGIERQPDDG
jgi:peroxiredoxin Q/BCP